MQPSPSSPTPTEGVGKDVKPRDVLDLDASCSETEPDVPDVPEVEGGQTKIPSLNDSTAVRPQVGEIHLSKSAIRCRLRRVMAPNVHGKYKVCDAIIAEYQKPVGHKDRVRLEHIFSMCAYDPETCLIYG